MIEISGRDSQVLEAVVSDYLQSGEPVGSRTIAKRYGLKVSSATIRNIMSDLEELGLLSQPHTSAGRVPTERGLRVYLDTLMRSKTLGKEERSQIRRAFQENKSDIQAILQQTSKVLSRFCKQAGVVLWPKWKATRLKHIEFVRLRAHQVMVILISNTGMVKHSLIEWPEDIKQEELDKCGRYLNELCQDLPLGEVKQRVLDEMLKEKVLFDTLYARALEVTQQFFESSLENSDVYIEGQTNLLKNPEFTDVQRLKGILEALENKSRIIRLLDMSLKDSPGVQIILGPESELQELQEISLISSPYSHGDTLLGVLGVIGPMRMDYPRIIPVVGFTASLLSQLLNDPDEI